MSPKDEENAEPAGFDPATPLSNSRNEAFVQNVFGDGSTPMTAKAAYIKAGYKARGNAAEVNAARLLRNAQVAARLEFLKQQAASKKIASKQEVAELLTDILRARHTDFLEMGEHGVRFFKIDRTTANLAALTKIKTEVVNTRDGDTMVFHTVEMEKKTVAAATLAKLMAYNAPEQHEHTGKDGKPILHAVVGGPPRAKDIADWERQCEEADRRKKHPEAGKGKKRAR